MIIASRNLGWLRILTQKHLFSKSCPFFSWMAWFWKPCPFFSWMSWFRNLAKHSLEFVLLKVQSSMDKLSVCTGNHFLAEWAGFENLIPLFWESFKICFLGSSMDKSSSFRKWWIQRTDSENSKQRWSSCAAIKVLGINPLLKIHGTEIENY